MTDLRVVNAVSLLMAHARLERVFDLRIIVLCSGLVENDHNASAFLYRLMTFFSVVPLVLVCLTSAFVFVSKLHEVAEMTKHTIN